MQEYTRLVGGSRVLIGRAIYRLVLNKAGPLLVRLPLPRLSPDEAREAGMVGRLRTAVDAQEASETPATAPGSKANQTQVGGAHYHSAYQHWDFVREAELDYLQGCATKYVARWRKKNGLEDLHKARHYLEKRMENAMRPNSMAESLHWGYKSWSFNNIFRFGLANDLTVLETQIIAHIVRGEWDDAIEMLDTLIRINRAKPSVDVAVDTNRPDNK